MNFCAEIPPHRQGDSLYVIAQRIGYRRSGIVIYPQL